MKKNFILPVLTFISFSINAQNVGIGTTSPAARLEVVSNVSKTAQFNGQAPMYIAIFENDVYKGYLGSFAGAADDVDFGTGTGNNAGKLHLTIKASPMLTIQPDGNVGIGTTIPTEARLQIHEPAGNTQFIAAAGSNQVGISTFVPSSAPSLGFNVRYQNGYKFMGAGFGGFFQFVPSTGKLLYYYSSGTGVADGSVSSVFALGIDSSGQLGIGTSVPKAPLHVTGNVVFASSSITPATGYRLSVDGKIICEELKVQLSGSWPDYVFENSYPLIPLDQLQKQVMTQKHLPGIPTASRVASDNGIEMGDMQKRLLEKVEELYRYTFELNEKNSRLEAKIAELQLELKKVLE